MIRIRFATAEQVELHSFFEAPPVAQKSIAFHTAAPITWYP
jgi:hypothetical protein